MVYLVPAMSWNSSAMPWLRSALAAAFLTGCSGGKTIDRDEAQADIRLTRSFAAETGIFLDFLLRGQATVHFAAEHARLLEKEIERLLKDLEGSAPDPNAESSVRECRRELSALVHEVSRIH